MSGQSFANRIQVLPRVSKTWKYAASQPSSSGNSIVIDRRQQQLRLQPPRPEFFRSKSAFLNHLGLLLPADTTDYATMVLSALGVTSALRSVCIDFGCAEHDAVAPVLHLLGSRFSEQLEVLCITGIKVKCVLFRKSMPHQSTLADCAGPCLNP